ncbi:MAG: hypothetical protein KBD37_03905 [Burkholderiales bacterium]|nr:hypothetical protein [Burkholderiales bacterium]
MNALKSLINQLNDIPGITPEKRSEINLNAGVALLNHNFSVAALSFFEAALENDNNSLNTIIEKLSPIKMQNLVATDSSIKVTIKTLNKIDMCLQRKLFSFKSNNVVNYSNTIDLLIKLYKVYLSSGDEELVDIGHNKATTFANFLNETGLREGEKGKHHSALMLYLQAHKILTAHNEVLFINQTYKDQQKKKVIRQLITKYKDIANTTHDPVQDNITNTYLIIYQQRRDKNANLITVADSSDAPEITDNDIISWLDSYTKTPETKTPKKHSALALLILGELHIKLKNFNKAENYLKKAMDRSKQSQQTDIYLCAIHLLSKIYDEKKDRKQSIIYLEKFIYIMNGHNSDSIELVQALFKLGSLYLKDNKYDESLTNLNRATNKLHGRENSFDKYNALLSSLAEIHYHKNDFSKAREYLLKKVDNLLKQSAAGEFTREQNILLAEAYHLIAITHLRTGEYESAGAYLTKSEHILTVLPDKNITHWLTLINIWHSFACMYYNLDESENALAVLNKASNEINNIKNKKLTPDIVKTEIMIKRLQIGTCLLIPDHIKIKEYAIIDDDIVSVLPSDIYNEFNELNILTAKSYLDNKDCNMALHYLSQLKYTGIDEKLLRYADSLQEKIALELPKLTCTAEDLAKEIESPTTQVVEGINQLAEELGHTTSVEPLPSSNEQENPIVESLLSSNEQENPDTEYPAGGDYSYIPYKYDIPISKIWQEEIPPKSSDPVALIELRRIACAIPLTIGDREEPNGMVVIPHEFFESVTYEPNDNNNYPKELPLLRMTRGSGREGIKPLKNAKKFEHTGFIGSKPYKIESKIYEIKTLGSDGSKRQLLIKLNPGTFTQHSDSLKKEFGNIFIALLKLTKSEKTVKKVDMLNKNLDNMIELCYKLSITKSIASTTQPTSSNKKPHSQSRRHR